MEREEIQLQLTTLILDAATHLEFIKGAITDEQKEFVSRRVQWVCKKAEGFTRRYGTPLVTEICEA